MNALADIKWVIIAPIKSILIKSTPINHYTTIYDRSELTARRTSEPGKRAEETERNGFLVYLRFEA